MCLLCYRSSGDSKVEALCFLFYRNSGGSRVTADIDVFVILFTAGLVITEWMRT